MAQYKYWQADWKFVVFTFGSTFLTYKLLLSYVGFGIVMLLSLAVEVIILALCTRYFVSVTEFRDSYLLLKKGFFKKPERIPYSEVHKLTYSNATRFLKLNLYTANSKIELPPPARLAQAKELFTWLKIKNPKIEFEIIQPNPDLD